MQSSNYLKSGTAASFVLLTFFSSNALSQNFDTNTIKNITKEFLVQPDNLLIHKDGLETKIHIPQISNKLKLPENAKNIKFTLKKINFEGFTAINLDQLKEIYSNDINKEISIARIYEIAEQITLTYRNSGYFLATAFVPDQDINDGTLTIKVIEGHIGDIQFDFPVEEGEIFHQYIEELKSKKPITSKDLESVILKLNDIPGMEFRAVVSSLEKEEGAVKLTLLKQKPKHNSSLSLVNYPSQYLGNQTINYTINKNFVPLQNTSASVTSSLPVGLMKSASIEHSVLIMSDLNIYGNINYLQANPNISLNSNPIEIDSTSIRLGVRYQYLRQRESSLDFKLVIDSKESNVRTNNTSSYITKDNIRALRFISTYYLQDKFQGNNAFKITFSKGLTTFGASNPNDQLLSRPNAVPDFSKIDFSYSRLQQIYNNWSILAFIGGQYSPNSLFASEEFSYGGANLGKAYEASQISGDKGIATSLKLKYQIPQNKDNKSEVYSFYDIGKAWNNDPGLENVTELGSSFGLGANITIDNSDTNLGIAWPLNTRLSDPSLKQDREARLFLQTTLRF